MKTDKKQHGGFPRKMFHQVPATPTDGELSLYQGDLMSSQDPNSILSYDDQITLDKAVSAIEQNPALGDDLSAIIDELGTSDFASRAEIVARMAEVKKHNPALVSRMEELHNKLLYSELNDELLSTGKLGKLSRDGTFCTSLVSIVEMLEWASGPLVLQRPEQSVYHRFAADVKAEHKQIPHSFLIQHDWAEALKNATELAEAGQVMLPAPYCCFELKISGRRVVYMIAADENGVADPYHMTDEEASLYSDAPFIEGPHGWCMCRRSAIVREVGDIIADPITGTPEALATLGRLKKMVFDQVRAACVTLEALITTTEVVRAPYKMNRLRVKRGRMPVLDHHVINLSKRSHASPLPPEFRTEEKRTSPRLHFRRGHFRHFPMHKVWINWMLVGNPDLGFIDKDYRL